MWPKLTNSKRRFEITERGNLAIEDDYGRIIVLNPREVAEMLQVIEQDPTFEARVRENLHA